MQYLVFLLILFFSFKFGLDDFSNIGHNWDWTIPSNGYLMSEIGRWSKYIWSEISFGSPSGLLISHLVPNVILEIFGKFLDSKFVILLLLVIVIAFSLFTFKKLLDYLKTSGNENYIFALLYAFSPFLFSDIIGGSWYMWISYAFAPIFFLYLVKFVRDGNYKHLLWFIISSVFVMSALQRIFLIEVITFLYLLFLIFQKDLSWNDFVKRYLISHLVLVLVNLYWILPFGYGVFDFAKETVLNADFVGGFSQIKNSTQSIFKIFTLTGYLNRDMYFVSLGFISQILVILSATVSWFFIFMSFSEKKNLKKMIPWVSIFLLLILIVKGANIPFGNLTLSLYENIPFLAFFRSPQHLMFVPAFIIPILLCFSYEYVVSIFKGKAKYILFILVLLWTSGWWLSGDLGHTSLKAQNRDFVDFYTLNPEFDDYLRSNYENELNHRVLFLPPVVSPQYLENEYQSRAQGGEPEYLYLKNPTFLSENNSVAREIENELCFGEGDKLFESIVSSSTKFVVHRKDILPKHTPCGFEEAWDKDYVSYILNGLDYLDEVFVGKYLDVYQLEDKYFRPIVYSLDNVLVEYIKVNPVKYEVRVSNVKGDAEIVLNQNYNKGWISNLDAENVERDGKNSWRVREDTEFIIEFFPQRLLHIGGIISICVFLVLFCVSLFYKK